MQVSIKRAVSPHSNTTPSIGDVTMNRTVNIKPNVSGARPETFGEKIKSRAASESLYMKGGGKC